MILRKKTILGLFLCTLVFSSSIPMLLGIQSSPNSVFGGDIITLSQVNSTTSLNTSLALDLNEDETVIASPEVYAFCMVKEEPMIARGVILDMYLEIDGGKIIEGEAPPTEFVVIGEKLARRAGLEVGDKFVLTGSTRPALYQMEVSAIYRSQTSADDMLIPLNIARNLAGLGKNTVSAIRVKTTNQTALIEDLEEKEEPVMISDGGDSSTVLNANVSEEERAEQVLALKYFEPEQFKASNGSFISVFVQEGENSIKIVIITFIILDGALTFIGASAILARAIIERRPDIGTLFAIGADKAHVRKLIAKDVMIISIPATVSGVIVGYAIVRAIEKYSLLLMFGQTIHPLINSEVMAGICIATMIIFVVSGIIINETLMKATPQDMMRDADEVVSPLAIPELESLLGVSD